MKKNVHLLIVFIFHLLFFPTSYSVDAAHASLGSENYDTTVFNFLSKMLEVQKENDRPTYIVLRSDHGLQGGPYPIDYSTQIEHMNPWTAIISPAQDLSSEILSNLAWNQGRLVTGFDLYHSIRYLMTPFKDKNEAAGIPPWSYNIFQESIPAKRNCKTAKIPIQFCPCKDERSDIGGTYSVVCGLNVFVLCHLNQIQSISIILRGSL
jgi:hypothetical protein